MCNLNLCKTQESVYYIRILKINTTYGKTNNFCALLGALRSFKRRYENSRIAANVKKQNLKGEKLKFLAHFREQLVTNNSKRKKKVYFHCSKRNFRQGTNAFLALVLLVYKLYSIAAILFLLKENSAYNSKLLHFYL